MRELYDADVVVRDLQNAPDLPEVVRGIDSLVPALSQWTDVYDEFRADAHEYVDAEPWVLVEVRWRGTTRDGALSVDVRQVDACKLADRKVIEHVLGYRDMETARRGVGRE